MASQSNRGRGRPAIFVGSTERAIVRVINRMGLMRAQRFLASEGVQTAPGQGKHPVNISLPTLHKLAQRNGITLKRGRPAKAAA